MDPQEWIGPGFEIRGVTIAVVINADGRFVGRAGEIEREHDEYEGLKIAMRNALAKNATKVSVPFCTIVYENDLPRTRPPYIRAGTVTGIHAGNNNLLIEWEDGTKSQEFSRKALKPLHPGVHDAILAFTERIHLDNRRLERLLLENLLDIRRETEIAIERAIAPEGQS